MSASETCSRLIGWAGLWAAGLLWAVNMQLGQILPYRECVGTIRSSAIISFTAAIIVLLAGLWSWRFTRANDGTESASSLRFAGGLSGLCALLFVFALTMQGIASLVLTGCER